MATEPTVLLCPECEQGKHRNCIGWTLNAADCEVPCECPECDGATDAPTGGFIPEYVTDKIPGHEDDQP
jgi:hypothetical protein